MSSPIGSIHVQQITRWGPSQRARFESFSSICGLPGSALAGQILGRFGNLAGFRIAGASSVLWMVLTGSARTGARFYFAQPAGIFMMTSYTAMSAMMMVEGTAAGMAQGELQGAIGECTAPCSLLCIPQTQPLPPAPCATPHRRFRSHLLVVSSTAIDQRLCLRQRTYREPQNDGARGGAEFLAESLRAWCEAQLAGLVLLLDGRPAGCQALAIVCIITRTRF